MIKLKYLKVNQAWAFVMGRQILRLGDYQMLFQTREDAIATARSMDMEVDGDELCIRHETETLH